MDDGHIPLSSSDEDLTLSSETSMNSFPLPGISISRNVADQEIPVSSLPEVTALDFVDSKADTVFQAALQDVLNIHDCNLQTGPEKSVDIVDPCSSNGKSVLSNEPVVIIAATSAIDSSSFPKKHILPPTIQKSPNSLQVTKSEAANPLQSFFQFPISGSQLTRDAKLMLPVSGLKALSVSEMANSDSLHSLYETESALTQTAFEKFSCLSSEKSVMVSVGPMSSNSLCQEENLSDQFTGTANIKQDEDLERAEEQVESGDSMTLSCEGVNRNVMTPFNLQHAIVMQVTSSELQALGSSSDVVTSNSEVDTSESGEESVHLSELKVPQQVSALPFAGQAMKLPLFSDAKTFATRKSGRPVDESSPRNKATLTVAKLLEKADSSKMNSQPTNRLTDSTTSLENSLRQSAIMSQLPFSRSSTSMTSIPMETANKMATISHSAAATMSFATISVNCLPAKLPMHLSTSLTRSFLIMDPTPLSITAPSYPLNLTESVQKVMPVVGLDSSPPPSPKLLASNRMSLAKFGGTLTSAAQLRSIALYAGTLAGKMVCENKSKELMQKTPAAATSFSVTEIMSILDCPKSTVDDLSFSGDLAQQKSTGIGPRVSSGESTSLDSTFCQSESIAVHLPIASILAKKEELRSEEKRTLGVSADKAPNVAVFCAADHSYSAMPVPFADKSSDDFCNGVEDLPEYLNSVEDCHDAEEQFCEITETLVNHFEDQDLFVDDLLSLDSFMAFDQWNEADLGNCNDSLEEDIEECVNDCVKKAKCSYLIETDCSEEMSNENCLQHKEENLKLGSKGKAVGGHRKDQLQSMQAETCLGSDNVTSSENCVMTVVRGLDQIQVDGKVLTRNNAEQMPPKGRQVEKMHSQPLLGSAILNIFPLEEVSSNISENIARENASHVACDQTTGDGVSLAASNCDDLKSQMQRKFPLRSSKSRNGARNRERRGGRFVRISPLDVQLDSFDESEKTNSSENSVDGTSGSLVSVDSKDPFLMTDSLNCLSSSGLMTTRSRDRKSTRTGENAAMLAGDELLSTDWTTVITECHLSPVASKLTEIDHCLENPISLRRSTRTLRKGGSVSSGEPNNCEPDSKFVTRRSCKRMTKYLQLTGSHSARNAMTEITGDYQEAPLSSQIPCIMDINKGTMVNHDEPTLSKGHLILLIIPNSNSELF